MQFGPYQVLTVILPVPPSLTLLYACAMVVALHFACYCIVPLEHLLEQTQVNEGAGSYLWHDHSGSNKADGLQGALIVHAKGPKPWQYDEERTLFVTDWFHGQSCCCCCCCCCSVGAGYVVDYAAFASFEFESYTKTATVLLQVHLSGAALPLSCPAPA